MAALSIPLEPPFGVPDGMSTANGILTPGCQMSEAVSEAVAILRGERSGSDAKSVVALSPTLAMRMRDGLVSNSMVSPI